MSTSQQIITKIIANDTAKFRADNSADNMTTGTIDTLLLAHPQGWANEWLGNDVSLSENGTEIKNKILNRLYHECRKKYHFTEKLLLGFIIIICIMVYCDTLKRRNNTIVLAGFLISIPVVTWILKNIIVDNTIKDPMALCESVQNDAFNTYILYYSCIAFVVFILFISLSKYTILLGLTEDNILIIIMIQMFGLHIALYKNPAYIIRN